MFPVRFGRMIEVSGNIQAVSSAFLLIHQKAWARYNADAKSLEDQVWPQYAVSPPHYLSKSRETVTAVIATGPADRDTFIRIAKESKTGYPIVDHAISDPEKDRAARADLIARLRPHITQTIAADDVDDSIEV